MFVIDCENGTTIIPCNGQGYVEVDRIAKENNGRLRYVPPGRTSMSTGDVSVGCAVMADYRNPASGGARNE